MYAALFLVDDLSDHLPIFAIRKKKHLRKYILKEKLEKLTTSMQNILLLIYNLS